KKAPVAALPGLVVETWMLVPLVIFMVTAPMLTQGVKIELP
ncbi:hypothetical protein PSYMO_36952, partial [Pseudomonas amygdali pv. mori str. 301020]